jgi:hypothetical protein
VSTLACSLGPIRSCRREAWVMNVEKDEDELALGGVGAVSAGLAPSAHERHTDGYWSELVDLHWFLRPLGSDSLTRAG